jgi:hypothetical protein
MYDYSSVNAPECLCKRQPMMQGGGGGGPQEGKKVQPLTMFVASCTQRAIDHLLLKKGRYYNEKQLA